jgi:hypothetical protein
VNISKVIAPTESMEDWGLIGPLGEVLRLPAAKAGPFRIALVGTRSSLVKTAKTKSFAAMLADLDQSVFVVDVRRNGAGGSGSWGPREFGTLIPDMIENNCGYSYHHLPDLAPEVELLDDFRAAMKLDETLSSDEIADIAGQLTAGTLDQSRIPACAWKHWQVFGAAYRRDLPQHAVLAGRAFVEAAAVAGGVAVFLCAEEYLPDFDLADQNSQDDAYCHRYTLASLIAQSLGESFPAAEISRVSLRMGDSPTVT